MFPVPDLTEFVLQDEGTFHLKDAAKNLLKGLGSQVSLNLDWRDMWTLVTKKGGGIAQGSYLILNAFFIHYYF